MSWSGGKDSCLALYEMQRARECRVAALLTTVTRDYDRISMHGVRRDLLERQAASLGLPLHEVFISKDATNQDYEAKMEEAFRYESQSLTQSRRDHFTAPFLRLGVDRPRLFY